MKEGKTSEDIFQHKYMTSVRFALTTVGAWPIMKDEKNSIKSKLLPYLPFYTIILRILCSIGMVLQVLYIQARRGYLQFFELGQIYITLLMSIVFLQRVTQSVQKLYCEVIEEFVTKFHLFNHRNNSEYSMKMYLRVTKICALFSTVSNGYRYFSSAMFNVAPLFNNYVTGMFSSEKPPNGTFEHAVYYELPFDQYTEFKYFLVVFAYNLYVSYNIGVVFCTCDLLLCLVVFHIWGHLNILKHDLNHFQRPSLDGTGEIATSWYTPEESKRVYERLKEIILYEFMIRKFLTKTNEAYSIAICFYYAFHAVTGCVLLLECSAMRAKELGTYGPLTVVMFGQLIQLSVMFELIGSKGDSIVDSAYGIPWECMDNRNRGLVLLFLLNVQKPLTLKAANVVPVGVQTMSQIIRGSVSYFVMLKTFASD